MSFLPIQPIAGGDLSRKVMQLPMPFLKTIETTPLRTPAPKNTVKALSGGGSAAAAAAPMMSTKDRLMSRTRLTAAERKKLDRLEQSEIVAAFCETKPTRTDVKKYFAERIKELNA